MDARKNASAPFSQSPDYLSAPRRPSVDEPSRFQAIEAKPLEDFEVSQWVNTPQLQLKQNARAWRQFLLRAWDTNVLSQTEQARSYFVSRAKGLGSVLDIEITPQGKDGLLVRVYVESRHTPESKLLYKLKFSIMDIYPDANLDIWIAEKPAASLPQAG